MASDNLRGSLWMMASMAGFAAEDGFLKSAASEMPLGQVLAFEGLLGILWFSTLALRAGSPPLPRAALSRTMAVRSAFEVAGRLFYALAVALTHNHLTPDALGQVSAPDAPGLGIAISAAAVQQYQVPVEIRVGGRSLYASPQF